MSARKKSGSVEEQFLVSLTRCQGLLRKHAECALGSTGITPAEYQLLRMIQEDPGMSAKTARSILSTSAPTIAQAVDALMKKGFLKRSANAQDARVQELYLTLKGRVRIGQARRAMDGALRSLGLSGSTLQSLTKNLGSVMRATEKAMDA